jgi:hypothetical protein
VKVLQALVGRQYAITIDSVREIGEAVASVATRSVVESEATAHKDLHEATQAAAKHAAALLDEVEKITKLRHKIGYSEDHMVLPQMRRALETFTTLESPRGRGRKAGREWEPYARHWQQYVERCLTAIGYERKSVATASKDAPLPAILAWMLKESRVGSPTAKTVAELLGRRSANPK